MTGASGLAPLLALVAIQFALYTLGWLLCGFVVTDERRSVWHLAAFMLIQSLGMALAAQRDVLRAWLPYVGADILWLASFVVLNRGLQFFLRLPHWHSLYACVFPAAVAGLIYMGPGIEYATWRVITSYDTVVLLLSATMYRSWFAAKSEFGVKIALLLTLPGWITCAGLLSRTAAQLLTPQQPLEMQVDDVYNVILLVAYLVSMALFNLTALGILLLRFIRRLQELSLRDPLTAVFNRRGFDLGLLREWQRARRTGETLALLMLDVDHFKDINDRHGHLTGDAVLTEIAKRLLLESRESDTLARIGGEEFAILLPASHDGAAFDTADRFRQVIASAPIATGQGVIGVNVSIGVALSRPGDTGPEVLLQRADAALYAAKRTGRNRVIVKTD